MASGVVVGWNRLTMLPSRSIRNLVKFHSMSPDALRPAGDDYNLVLERHFASSNSSNRFMRFPPLIRFTN